MRRSEVEKVADIEIDEELNIDYGDGVVHNCEYAICIIRTILYLQVYGRGLVRVIGDVSWNISLL